MITRGKAAFRLSLLATMAMLVLVWVPPTFADGTSTQSYTGTLATPEPATLLLLGTGLLAGYSKKRQHRRRLVLGPVKLSAQS